MGKEKIFLTRIIWYIYKYRVIRSWWNDTDLVRLIAWDCIKHSLQQLARTGPNHDAIAIGYCVPDCTMQTLDRFFKFWFKKPTRVLDVWKVTQTFMSFNHNRTFVTHFSPKRLVHRWIPTVNFTTIMRKDSRNKKEKKDLIIIEAYWSRLITVSEFRFLVTPPPLAAAVERLVPRTWSVPPISLSDSLSETWLIYMLVNSDGCRWCDGFIYSVRLLG